MFTGHTCKHDFCPVLCTVCSFLHYNISVELRIKFIMKLRVELHLRVELVELHKRS
jgi:hypothetical protein